MSKEEFAIVLVDKEGDYTNHKFWTGESWATDLDKARIYKSPVKIKEILSGVSIPKNKEVCTFALEWLKGHEFSAMILAFIIYKSLLKR